MESICIISQRERESFALPGAFRAHAMTSVMLTASSSHAVRPPQTNIAVHTPRSKLCLACEAWREERSIGEAERGEGGEGGREQKRTSVRSLSRRLEHWLMHDQPSPRHQLDQHLIGLLDTCGSQSGCTLVPAPFVWPRAHPWRRLGVSLATPT